MGNDDRPKLKRKKSRRKKKEKDKNVIDPHVYNAVPDTDTSGPDEVDEYGLNRSLYGPRAKATAVRAPLPYLNKQEYEFFEKVTSGEVQEVEALLGTVKINKTNRQGDTVLHIAVRRQDEAMVELLLKQPGIRLFDTILHAIRENNLNITKKLLAIYDSLTPEAKQKEYMPHLSLDQSKSVSASRTSGTTNPALEDLGIRATVEYPRWGRPHVEPVSRTGISNEGIIYDSDGRTPVDDEDIPFDSEFHPVVTPFMLAAKTGSYPLMELFWNRGEYLETKERHHNLNCECKLCRKQDGDGDLTRAHQRLQLFDAITQPAYICFLSRKDREKKIDPINYAISKILRLRKIVERDTAFEEKYAPFIARLETFITDMVGLCRNTNETKIFLAPKDPEGKERLPNEYPRLWYTVGLGLHKFVAHPNVQSIVYKLWATDDWPEWDTYGLVYKLFQFVIRIVGFPIIALLLVCFDRKSSIGKILGSPLSRFLTHVASYCVFLGILSFQVLWPYQRCNENFNYNTTDLECDHRGPPTIGTEWMLVVYVLSFYISIIKKNSVSWYWAKLWNWFELVGQIFFTLAFLAWLMAWVWVQLPENQPYLTATPRQMWPHDSAEVFGDCFIAVASLFAFARLLRFIVVDPTIGPIQIGLGKQILDFCSAALIYFSVLLAFASGLLALYVPYKDFTGVDDGNKTKKQDATFTTLSGTLENLFWYLYGHAGRDPVKLLNWVDNSTSVNVRIHHDYTEWTGTFLYISYHIVGQMMMFSMLAGYFAQTMTKINEDIDTHWKFARTELYLTFAKDTVLPSPFNLLPTLSGLSEMGRYLKVIGKKEDPKADCSLKQCCFITTGKEKQKDLQSLLVNYRKLIVELMYRYGSFKDERDAEKAASKDDVKELGEELSEIKAVLEKAKGKGGTGSRGTIAAGRSSNPPPPPPGGGSQGPSRSRPGPSVGGSPVVTQQPSASQTPLTTMYSAPPGSTTSPEQSPPSQALSKSKSTPYGAPPPQQSTTPSRKVPPSTSNQPSNARSAPYGASPQKSAPSTQKAPPSKQMSKTTSGPYGAQPPPLPKPLPQKSMTTDDSEAGRQAAAGRSKSKPRK